MSRPDWTAEDLARMERVADLCDEDREYPRPDPYGAPPVSRLLDLSEPGGDEHDWLEWE